MSLGQLVRGLLTRHLCCSDGAYGGNSHCREQRHRKCQWHVHHHPGGRQLDGSGTVLAPAPATTDRMPVVNRLLVSQSSAAPKSGRLNVSKPAPVAEAKSRMSNSSPRAGAKLLTIFFLAR